MTPTTNTARVATTTQTADAEKLLRDVAYVLKLTRRVKEEMSADRAHAQLPTAPTDRVLVA